MKLGIIISVLWLVSCGDKHGAMSKLNLATISAKQKSKVSYCLHSNLGNHRATVSRVAKSTIGEWQEYANVLYKEVSCNNKPDYVIRAIDDPNAARASATYPSSYKNQPLNLNLIEGKLINHGSLMNEILYGIMIHEWGHTLGFTHEHNDRGIPLSEIDNRSIMYYPFASKAYNNSDWDRARPSVLDKLGAMTRYPNGIFDNPENAIPNVFSEEQGSSSCSGSSVMIGLACYGKYCDNKRIFCAEPAQPLTRQTIKSAQFSDDGEVMTNNGFVKSIACKGRYCDNMILTYEVAEQSVKDCYWSAAFSEEEGYFKNAHHHICSRGKAVTGMRCSGSYCDNISVRCCSY